MQQYSIIDAFYLSFFSRALYRDVVARWKGFCLVYLVAVLALGTIPGVLRMQVDLGSWLRAQAPAYIRQLPRITITKGILSVDATQPYRILNEKTGEPVVILDSTGEITSLEGSKALVLVTKSAVLFRKGEKETRSYNLSEFDAETITINQGSAYDLLETLIDVIPLILYPFVLFFSFIIWSTQALVYALLGSLYARRVALPLSAPSAIRLSAVAMTPALAIGALLTTAGVSVPYWWLISVLGSLAYVLYGIQANVPLLTQEPSDEKNTGRR